ncbi:hypothetical protein POJ06DRAFT_284235 [Lipomyces tetrasporus]|uniref:Uncharacterized protein n=1 Tax=Lipomyces tetrasporus TaxID=54092 RepID=A0AAD7VVX9_9ASCO|nr:uncharacterized protein POJ06DRAFT_284235 [Lipomyces tetrasporus]KAJ8103434.1 hypothetical protein POJ06DRAFT_284235 [Lipomyces tetrasporus]
MSSAMSVALSKDKSPGPDENWISEFDKALNLLKSNAPEQWLDIQMPYSQYLKLEESWSNIKSDTYKGYPRLSYNSVTETVTVVTAPRNLHEVAASELRFQIMRSIREYLSHHSPESLGRIVDAGSSDVRGSGGGYEHSVKQADGLFQYIGPGAGPATVAFEVGFSQNYDSLLGNKDMWIQGCHAKACVLICLNESPRFRNPSGPFEDIGDVGAEKQAMNRHANATVPLNGSYFPQIRYRDHVWAGGVTEAFIEVWRADGHEKFPLIEDRRPHHNLTTTLGLHVSDFFEDDAWQALGIEDLNIPFDGTLYLTLLESGMVKLAEGRFADFITTP